MNILIPETELQRLVVCTSFHWTELAGGTLLCYIRTHQDTKHDKHEHFTDPQLVAPLCNHSLFFLTLIIQDVVWQILGTLPCFVVNSGAAALLSRRMLVQLLDRKTFTVLLKWTADCPMLHVWRSILLGYWIPHESCEVFQSKDKNTPH